MSKICILVLSHDRAGIPGVGDGAELAAGVVEDDPFGVCDVGFGAERGPDPRPAGGDEDRDAENGRCAGPVGEAGRHFAVDD